MAELDRLEVRLEADLSQFRGELQKAERATQATTAGMARQFAALDRAAGPLNERLGSLRQSSIAFAESTQFAAPGRHFADLSAAARGFGSALSSAFEDAVLGGRKLSTVLRGLETDILRVLTRRLVTQPLTEAITGLLGGGEGGGGLLASLFHRGGVAGQTSAPQRPVPAALFADAPRFAGGGMVGPRLRLAPDEVPAILHRGETVRTRAQEATLAAAAAPAINVTIMTPNPRAFADSRGQIEAALADAVRRGRRNR